MCYKVLYNDTMGWVMAQTVQLMESVKQLLKAEGKTYADVANALELSEASIKRIFAEGNISIQRLEAIAQMIGLELSDIVRHMQKANPAIEKLTWKQEAEITNDLQLVLVMVCVFSGWSVKDIISNYSVTETDCISKLLTLEKIGVLELMPSDRVKLKIGVNFAWLNDGPIQRFFRERVGNEYFSSDFTAQGESLRVMNGMLSPESHVVFERKLVELAREFNSLCRADAALPVDSCLSTTCVLAVRGWNYGVFSHLKR
jgi:transcriptional regulator with XRE-family HTH domain